MPNNKYLRSVKRERQLVNEARAKGLIAGRTAGSHSPVDVFVFDPKDGMIRLIQVKTKKGARMMVMKDKRVYQPACIITATYSWE